MSIFNRDTENGKFDWIIDEYFAQQNTNTCAEEECEEDGFTIAGEEYFNKPAEPVLCPWTGTVLNP